MSETLNTPPKLIIPGHNPESQELQLVTPPELSSPKAYELHLQKQIQGQMGLGSIRNESVAVDKDKAEEDNEKFIKQALNPLNILDLKATYDRRVEKSSRESSFTFDKTVSKNTEAKQRTELELKNKLIEEYLQTGNSSASERQIDPKLKEQLTKQMDLSYAELEAKLRKSEVKFNSKPPTTESSKTAKGETVPDKTLDDDATDSKEPTKEDLLKESIDRALEEAEAIKKAQKLTIQEKKDIEQESAKFTQLAAVRERSGLRNARNPKGTRSLGSIAIGQKVTKETLDQSRVVLEKYRRRNNEAMRQRLTKAGADEKTINIILKLQDQTLTKQIGAQITEGKLKLEGLADPNTTDGQDKELGFWTKNKLKFYDWWAKQDGAGDKFFSSGRLKGTAKRAAVVGAIGIPVGFTLGALAVPAIASGAAGAVAVMAARGTNGLVRSLTSSHIDKRASAVADKKRNALSELQMQSIEAAYSPQEEGEKLSPWLVTDAFLDGAEQEVSKNRKRTIAAIGSVVLGAVAAYSFSLLGDSLFNGGGGRVHHLAQNRVSRVLKQPEHNVIKNHQPGLIKSTKPKIPSTNNGEIVATNQNFTIKPGDGITNEISRYASLHGKPINSAKSYQIYQQLAATHGDNILKISGSGPSTLMHGSQVWIARPGVGTWAPGVEDEIDKLLN